MYTVGIMGAGSIGAMKPDNIDSPKTFMPLTHAHAVYSNKNFHLSWIFDKSIPAMQQAQKKWRINSGTCFDPVDVVVIASPTETHLEEITKICESKKENRPRLIVLEKPAGINIHEATKIDYLTKEMGIKVVVNYGRRFNNMVLHCAETIKREETIQNIVFYYTRGFIRDGSHAIDMLNLFAGNFVDGHLLPMPIIDHTREDPTYGAYMNYSRCPYVLLIPLDGRDYDIFEMHIKTNETSWDFYNHFQKMSTTFKQQEPTYGNYHSMPAPEGCYWETDLSYSLEVLYRKIFNHLSEIDDGNYFFDTTLPQNYICGMKEAIRVHAVIDRLMIKKQIEENEK